MGGRNPAHTSLKYIIVDIDGTLADSTGRNHKLPAFTGKSVTLAQARHSLPVGTQGTVMGRREIEGSSQSIVNVRWHTTAKMHFDQPYVWDDFMAVTGQSFIQWHEGILEDTPIEFSCWLLKSLRPMMLAQNISALFLTSRWESARGDTMAWLGNHGLTLPGFGDLLEMRPDEDPRKDTEFKGEVLDRFEADGHSFFFALEDRRAVANYLRSRNIPVFHMADYE